MIDLMKYQVHELGKMGETDEIATSTLEDLQPILVEPSWPAWSSWPSLVELIARQAGGLVGRQVGSRWALGRQQAAGK